VFNDEPDVWGTQHNPKADRVEIPLQHTEGHDATRPFAVAVVPSSVDRGRLLVIWGSHEWTADFVIGS
jgi:ectoine hydroxylase-related dioxygenase (phytanoyl-CoA dioxygenase family)